MLNLHYTVCYKHNFLVNVDTRQIEFSSKAAKGHFIFWNLSSVYIGNMQLAFPHVIGTRVICFV